MNSLDGHNEECSNARNALLEDIGSLFAPPILFFIIFAFIYIDASDGRTGDIEMNQVQLQTISLLLTAITAIGAVIAAIASWRSAHATKAAASANAFATAINILQSDSVRKGRKIIFDLDENHILHPEWDKEQKEAAELVSSTYDIVAIMIRAGMLPKEVILNWRTSIIRSWNTIEPYLKELRRARNAHDQWDDFEWLATEAKKASNNLGA